MNDKPRSKWWKSLNEHRITGENPYFIFTLFGQIVSPAILGVVFTSIGVIFVVAAYPSLPTAAICSLMGLFWFYLGVGPSLYRVWRADFYGEYFKYGRLMTGSPVGYDQIERMSTQKEKRSLRTRTVIQLYFKGLDKPLVIPGNAKSPGMDVDLLTWLQGKIAR
jgi:hypothetical protein